MLKFIPTLKKIFLFTSVGILLFLATGVTLTYVFQDKIIALFIEEVNKQIKTPVKVDEIDLSILEKFPQLTVSLKNVWVQEGVKNSTEPLAKAKNLYFVLSLYELLKGNYQINQVHLEQAEVFLKIFPNGYNNYTIFEKDSTSQGSKVSFQIKKINLENVLLNYSDIRRDQEYDLIANKAVARLSSSENIYDIAIDGDVLSQKIRIQQETFFREKQMRIKSEFNYHVNSDSINILPSLIYVHDSKFLVEGVYHGADKNYVNISSTGENTDIQTILSLMSESVYNKFKVYRSEGNIYFSSSLVGNISETDSPELRIKFGSKNASLYHPDIKRKLENVNLEGEFYSKKANDLSTATLTLNNVSGQMEGRQFNGNLYLENFEDYFVKLNIDAEIDARSLLEFYPIASIKKASGLVDLDILFEGKINNLRNNNSAAIKTSGEIILKNLQFELASSKLPFKDFKGSFIFKNDDLAISDFSGSVGSSDFLLNGFFKNIVAFLVFDDQPISIEADLNSDLVDLDELLTGNVAENPESQAEGEQYYSFKISPKLELTFNCNVKGLKFRRFVAQSIKGKLKVKDQNAQASNINMSAAGGIMNLDGRVDARKENFIEVNTEASFDKIHIDSIFYLFYNFNQDFLVDRHLKGQISAEVNSYMVFDNKLRFDSKKFRSDVGVSIRNGELNNFEPMQKLSKFVAEESLSKLRFSELNNIIKIQDETIFLPPMDVRSNISTIQIRGTHTFNQHIDYYVRVPLRTFSKKDKDEAYGAIEDTGNGGANLFLTIKGTTDDYSINYDSKAVKQKIKEDIKKEGQELKEVFQNKGRKEKEDVELNEDEYFDF